RAGLYPRLRRDDRHFLPLPVIRPERGALYSETGLLSALGAAFQAAKIDKPRAELRAAIQGGSAHVKTILETLTDQVALSTAGEDSALSRPTVILSIDQAEELFLAEAYGVANTLLALLRDLLTSDSPSVIGIITIRSDNYERLQET